MIALFGAEFLLPIYLQYLRGQTAFQTGLILLPMAITGGFATILAGRLYDRLGPRPLLAIGFGILIVNTWQLSQIKADTPISWIMFLLALRGLAFGATIQTTFVTALSAVPLPEIAQGSSLTNATRQVFQAIGIAILATVLASTLSPKIYSPAAAIPERPAADRRGAPGNLPARAAGQGCRQPAAGRSAGRAHPGAGGAAAGGSLPGKYRRLRAGLPDHFLRRHTGLPDRAAAAGLAVQVGRTAGGRWPGAHGTLNIYSPLNMPIIV